MKRHEQIADHLGIQIEEKNWNANSKTLSYSFSVKLFNDFWEKLDKPLRISGALIVKSQIIFFRGMDYEET